MVDHIRRAADHPTRMAEIIRKAAKFVPVPEKANDQIQAVAKRLRDMEKRTKSVLGAIEAGGAGIKSLLDRLAELQT